MKGARVLVAVRYTICEYIVKHPST